MSWLTNIFRRKAAAEAPLIFGAQEGRIAFPPRNPDTLIKEGFEKNPVVYKCVDDISRAVASIPLLVYSGDKEIDNHPISSLIIRANPTQTLSTLIRDVIAQYLVTGNGYVEAVLSNKGVGELWSKRSEFMRIKPGRNMVAAYEYNSGGGSVSWPVDQMTGDSNMLHLHTISLSNDFYGTSPLEAAASNVDQLNEIDIWNYATLRRGPMYRGVFMSDGTKISDDEIRDLREQLDRKYSGARSAGKPPILPSGLTWQNTSINPRDMAITENKDLTARFICLAFGYPPTLLGMAGGSTFSNVAEAREYLWDNTILPLLNYVLGEINNWLQQWYPGIALVPDLDQVTALETRRERTWRRLKDADFLTANEKRDALGYAPVSGGDTLLISAGMLPLGGEMGETIIDAKKWENENMADVVRIYDEK